MAATRRSRQSAYIPRLLQRRETPEVLTSVGAFFFLQHCTRVTAGYSGLTLSRVTNVTEQKWDKRESDSLRRPPGSEGGQEASLDFKFHAFKSWARPQGRITSMNHARYHATTFLKR